MSATIVLGAKPLFFISFRMSFSAAEADDGEGAICQAYRLRASEVLKLVTKANG